VEEIGRRLRAAREAKGITLEQAEEDTKIRRKYLLALEAGREADIPGEVYVKGFLRSYGNYLGLDGPALVEEYKRIKLKEAMERVAGEGQPGEGTTGEPSAARRQRRQAQRQAGSLEGEANGSTSTELLRRPLSARSLSRDSSRTLWRSLTLLVVALILIGGIWAVYRKLAASPSTTPLDQGGGAAVQPAETPSAGGEQETEEQTGSEDDSEAQPLVWMEQGQDKRTVIFHVAASEAEVTFEFGQGRVWLEAFSDGKMVFSRELPAGAKDPLVLKGRKVEVNVGNMVGTSVVVNGVRFERPLEGGPYWLIFQAES